MTFWFGEPWPSRERPAPQCCNGEEKVNTPTGLPCHFCEEGVIVGDRGVMLPTITPPPERLPLALFRTRPLHVECMVRGQVGPVAHRGQQPDGMSKRQDALFTFNWLRERGTIV